GVGSDFVIDDGTRKNTGDGGWCHAVGPTTCKAGFVVQKVGEKPADQVVWMCCFFCARKRSKNAHFWWVIVRAILVFILKGYLWDCDLALSLVTSGLSSDLLGNGFESILSEVVALKATPATTGIVRGCDHL
ncbi:TPA: hypothetical protein ACHKK4_005102, partial [Escherichia coli]